jgi:DNA-binding CsgD family transcriptional regulator
MMHSVACVSISVAEVAMLGERGGDYSITTPSLDYYALLRHYRFTNHYRITESLLRCVGRHMTSIEMTVGDQWSQRLTRREQQVALLIVRGLSNKEVARELGLSHGTVKLHVHRIFQKTGVRNRYSLIIQMSAHSAGRL